MRIGSRLCVLALLFSPAHALSQPAIEAPASVDAVAPPTPCCTIPAGTIVSLEMLETVNSQANHTGDHFRFRLVDPIEIGGKLLVAAGVEGVGDVVHAAKSRFGGKPGELIIAARYLDDHGLRIGLRSFRLGVGTGKNNDGIAAAFAIAGGVAGGVISMFITGGEVNVPAGTQAYAKVATDVSVAPPRPSE